MEEVGARIAQSRSDVGSQIEAAVSASAASFDEKLAEVRSDLQRSTADAAAATANASREEVARLTKTEAAMAGVKNLKPEKKELNFYL